MTTVEMSVLPSVPDQEDPFTSTGPTGGAKPDSDPKTSLTALADVLDANHADVPGFLNGMLSYKPLNATASTSSSSGNGLGSLDKELNELLTRLSLLSQDTSSALEQSIHDISRTVPRLTYDLQFMRESASSLQSSLHLVQDHVARQTRMDTRSLSPTATATESDDVKTHRSMEKLTHLDKLKNRMESARDILREAESWSTLEGEITSFIASQAWSKAGNRLAEASRSMVVFQNTPAEFESRKSLLVSLQNELETSLSAALDESLAKNDVEAIGNFYEIFELMDRVQEFKGYYFGARRKTVMEEWSAALLLDALQPSEKVAEGTPIKYSAFLPRFYASFLSIVSHEKSQIAQIFPPHLAPAILATFVQTTLDALSPSLQSRLGAVADFYGTEALPELIKAYKATEEFGLSTQGLMDKMAFNTQGDMLSGAHGTSSPDAISPGLAPVRTRSRRLSLSRRYSRAASSLSEGTASLSVWETTLYEPFLDLQMAYPSLERKYLAHQLRFNPAFIGAFSRSTDNIARLLAERASIAISTAEEAITRCVSFTHGYGSKGLVDALNSFFEGFFDTLHDLLEKADDGGSSKPTGNDELDFDGLDYSTEDWGSFQTGLHVLTTCKEVRDRTSAFEENLSAYFGRLALSLGSDAPLPEHTTRGALTLLHQSPLNSSDLQTMLSTSTERYNLQSARTALGSLTRTAQRRLQSIILAPIITQLNSYPALGVWATPDKPARKGELSIPTFSLSPTDVIVRVSEGLLNLLRVFEVYASDASLSYSIETLPFVDPVMLEINTDSVMEQSRADKLVSPTSLTHTASASATTALSPETVLSTWISSLTLSLLAHLSSITLPSIRSLSNSGAKQLEADLDYLSNAVRALDVEWEELETWKEGVSRSVEDLRQKARSGGDRSVLDKIIRMKERQM